MMFSALFFSSVLFGAEMVITVPEGMVVTNTVAVNAVTAGDVLVKAGKGTWYTQRQIGSSVNFSKMVIREGTFENACLTGFFNPPRIEIRSGATLKQLNNASYNDRGVTVQIDRGGVFNDLCPPGGQSFAKLTAVTGEGTFVNFYGSWVRATLPGFTGDVVSGAGRGGTVYFGDGASAANDPDLRRFGSITMGGGDGSGRYPEMYFRNVAPMVVANRFGGKGQLGVVAGSVVTFTDLWKTYGSSSAFSCKGTMTNVNGRISLPSNAQQYNMDDVNARYVQVGGVAYGQYPVTRQLRPYSRLGYPAGSMLHGVTKSGYGTRILLDGAEFWTQFQQPFRTEVRGGSTLVVCGGAFQIANATATEPVSFRFDRGTLQTVRDTYTRFVTDKVVFEVGPGGMEIRATGRSNYVQPREFTEGCVFRDNGSNGPVVFRGNASTTFYAPLDIGGTVSVLDGTVNIPNRAAYYADGAKPPFGTGSLVLDQGCVLSCLPQGRITRLADGPGATLRLTGSALLQINSNNTGTDWRIGPTSATSSSIVREKGAALFFGNKTGGMYDFFRSDGSRGTCVVCGGLPLGTNGKLPVVPVFVHDYTSTHSGDSWGGEVDFLTYGATGLVRFGDYATAFGGDAKDVVFIGADTTLSSSATVAGLNLGKSKKVTIGSGATLTIGDGTGTACVLLQGATVKGAGTLDFGAAEGVVSSSPRGGTISANIAGSGGLSVVASYLADMNEASVVLSGNNTYSGGTRISSHRVSVKSDTAFGTGDVWALGGEGNGGQIRIGKGLPKLTIANDLHLSGHGLKEGYQVDDRNGALWVSSSVELTGSVELAGPTRVIATGAATEVRFSGVISGDSVEFYNRTASVTNAGTVVYAADNTYTGRTEVVRTTLVLEPGASAGSGEMVLDGGELVLKFGPDGMSLPNPLRGAGLVRFAGPRNRRIDFASAPADDPFFQQEHRLDVNDRDRIVNTLASFSSVTNSGSRLVHLSVLNDAKDSFAGDVSDNVVLHFGKAYVKGLTVFVH